MPHQNRVTPWGEIRALPGRGMLMGNRGILHDDEGRIARDQTTTGWVCCLTSFRGRRVPLAGPGHYTPLFFLDEPTALAAGHRPCSTCRRRAAQGYARAWRAAFGNESPLAPAMNARLSRERRVPYRGDKVTYRAALRDLPSGAMIERRLPGEAAPSAWLVWNEALLRWTSEGYTASERRPPGDAGGAVTVLTPAASVAVLARGYAPVAHPSALG